MVLPPGIINAVQSWLNAIPPEQRDTPTVTLFVEGAWNTLTPNQVMDEVRRGTAVGESFVEKVLGINLELGTI